MSEESRPKFSFGALAPSHLAWQEGKTAATIKWVSDLESGSVSVKEVLEALKSGALIANEFPRFL